MHRILIYKYRLRILDDSLRTDKNTNIRISDNIVRLLKRFASKHKLDISGLYEATGISNPENSSAREYGEKEIDSIHMALAEKLGDDFALGIGEAMVLTILGDLGNIFLHSPNLLEIIKIYESSQQLFGNGISMKLIETPESVSISLYDFHKTKTAYRYRRDGFFSVILSCMRIISGKSILPVSVKYTADIVNEPKYKKFFGVTPETRCANDEIVFKRSDLMQRPIFSDDHEFEYLMRRLKKISLSEDKDSIRDKAVKILRASLPGKFPSVKQLAFHLGMSTRNLQKHLAKEKISVRQLKNITIAGYAKTRYHTDNKSVAQIANELGYSEPTVLSRIYKKITGDILSKDL